MRIEMKGPARRKREGSSLRNPPERPVRVLHIVDRVTGGVPVAVRTYISNSSDRFEHHVLSPYGENGEPAPVWSGLGAEQHDLGHGSLSRMRAVRALTRSMRPDTVHMHSSFAGAYGRIASAGRARLVYTPHCYSFVRTDISKSQRSLYRALEWALGWRTHLVAACGPGEASIALGMRSNRGRVRVVPNVASVSNPGRPIRADSRLTAPIRVGMLGRLSPQKDPREFVRIVRRLRSDGVDVQPLWIGDGEWQRDELDDAEITVTGWLEGEALATQLESLDVYIHSAAWEGFPIAVLDAHASGLPILVRQIPAFAGVDTAQTTGLGLDVLAASTEEGFEGWRDRNRSLWARCLSENTPAAQSAALTNVWGGS